MTAGNAAASLIHYGHESMRVKLRALPLVRLKGIRTRRLGVTGKVSANLDTGAVSVGAAATNTLSATKIEGTPRRTTPGMPTLTQTCRGAVSSALGGGNVPHSPHTRGEGRTSGGLGRYSICYKSVPGEPWMGR